jgi:hypothetical protein
VGVLDIVTGRLEIIERGEPFVGQRASEASTDAMSYTPGPSAVDLSRLLGGGVSLLEHSTHAIFSNESALTSSGTPFEFNGLGASSLPPGWSEGGASLTSAPLPEVSLTPAGIADITSGSIGFASASQGVEFTTAASVDARPAKQTAPPPLRAVLIPEPPPNPAPRPLNQKARRKARVETVAVKPTARPSGPPKATQANFDKVREFYRLEFTLEQRKEIGRSLAEALNTGVGSDQLLKIAIKPVLESGQKRYKVLDELIATKTWVEKMPPEQAYDTLSQLVS